MTAELGTTNLLLGIMAAASALEALVFIGAGIESALRTEVRNRTSNVERERRTL